MMSLKIFREITNNKPFSYQVRMATILLTKQEAYEVLIDKWWYDFMVEQMIA